MTQYKTTPACPYHELIVHSLNDIIQQKQGFFYTKNARYPRYWQEVSFISSDCSAIKFGDSRADLFFDGPNGNGYIEIVLTNKVSKVKREKAKELGINYFQFDFLSTVKKFAKEPDKLYDMVEKAMTNGEISMF